MAFGANGEVYGLDGANNNESFRSISGGLQFNSSALGRTNQTDGNEEAVYALAFEAKQGITINNLTVTLGTAATNGGAYTSNFSTNGLGAVQVTIYNGSVTHTFFDEVLFLDASGPNSMPTTVLTPDSTLLLDPGVYRMDIVHLGKPTGGQGKERSTLYDISLTGTPVAPIPEPSTYAMLAAGLLGLMIVLRRRR